MISKQILLAAVVLIAIIATSCSSIIENAVPKLEVVGPPEIVEFEMPSTVTVPIVGIDIGAGNTAGKLVIRLPVEASNPNASPLKITKLEYDIFLKNNLVATGIQDNRVDISGNGLSRFDLDVTVPIDTALASSPDLIAFGLGTPTQVKVDAKVTIDILGITKVSVKREVFNQMVTAPPIDLPF